jgi:hypothetical protein
MCSNGGGRDITDHTWEIRRLRRFKVLFVELRRDRVVEVRGLKRLEVQVPAPDAAVIRKAAAILGSQPEVARRLRIHLGFGPEPSHALTALDVFAMKEPLSPRGEALWEKVMRQIDRDRKDPVLGGPRDVDL